MNENPGKAWEGNSRGPPLWTAGKEDFLGKKGGWSIEKIWEREKSQGEVLKSVRSLRE